MSITREQAATWFATTHPPGPAAREMYRMSAKALRTPTREQVERMRGEWVGMTDDDGCTWFECSRCEHNLDRLEEPNNFCPNCGSPMTDEAVDIIMERLEALKDGY